MIIVAHSYDLGHKPLRPSVHGHCRPARRVKGDVLNLSHSRSLAVEKRKKTLLEEYRRVRCLCYFAPPPAPPPHMRIPSLAVEA